MQKEFDNIKLCYTNYTEIYTDGSKGNNKNGCAATSKNTIY